MVKGDDVRIAGVTVGSVKKVEIIDRDQGAGRPSASPTSTVTANTNATIKFRNLVGQRYIALTQGVGDLDADAGRTRRSR